MLAPLRAWPLGGAVFFALVELLLAKQQLLFRSCLLLA